jgi:hypothetical protein
MSDQPGTRVLDMAQQNQFIKSSGHVEEWQVQRTMTLKGHPTVVVCTATGAGCPTLELAKAAVVQALNNSDEFQAMLTKSEAEKAATQAAKDKDTSKGVAPFVDYVATAMSSDFVDPTHMYGQLKPLFGGGHRDINHLLSFLAFVEGLAVDGKPTEMAMDTEGTPSKYMQLAAGDGSVNVIVFDITEQSAQVLTDFFQRAQQFVLIVADLKGEQDKLKVAGIILSEKVKFCDVQKEFDYTFPDNFDHALLRSSTPSLESLLQFQQRSKRPVAKWANYSSKKPYAPFDVFEELPDEHVVYAAVDVLVTLGLHRWARSMGVPQVCS